MPAIKPRTTQKHLVRHITRLYRENNETLFSYAAFIGESTEYVLNQLVETVLAKDRDFQAWRAGPSRHARAEAWQPSRTAVRVRSRRRCPNARTHRPVAAGAER